MSSNSVGGVAAAQKSCRDWINQTIVFIVDSFYCFVSIVLSFYCIDPIGLDLLRAAT